MTALFYIAAFVAVISSIKVVTSLQSTTALLYFVISLLATAVIFFTMQAYFSAVLVVLLFVGATSLLFLFTLSILEIKIDNTEDKTKGIRPKTWLGPLILVFILFIILIYCIAINDFQTVPSTLTENKNLIDKLLSGYILVVELAILLLLGAMIIGYQFVHALLAPKKTEENSEKIK